MVPRLQCGFILLYTVHSGDVHGSISLIMFFFTVVHNADILNSKNAVWVSLLQYTHTMVACALCSVQYIVTVILHSYT